MKKIFSKIVLGLILTFLPLLTIGQMVYAVGDLWTTAVNTLDTKGENACIKTDEEKKYVITFIEEPLETGYEAPTGDPFIARPCVRNTIIFVPKATGEKTKFHSEIKKTCMTNLGGDGGSYTLKVSCQEVMAILSKGGSTMIEGYISLIYNWAAGIVGIIAVLVIVLSGIQIAASGGEPDALTSAKSRIIKSLAGLAVLFLSGVILYTVNPNYFTADKADAATFDNYQIENAAQISGSKLVAVEYKTTIVPKPSTLPGPSEKRQAQDANNPRKSLIQVIVPRYTAMLTGFVAAFAFLFLVIGGVRFVTSYGNTENVEKAKKQVIYALVGLFVAILAYTLITIIINLKFFEEKATSQKSGEETSEPSGSAG